MEGAGHKGVISHGVCKDHELGARNGGIVFGQLGRFLDDLAHLLGCIHVDARAGAGDVYGGTHDVRSSQRLRNGADELLLRGGSALFYQGGIAAHEIDAYLLGRLVQRLRCINGVSLYAGHHQRDGGDGDALIDNGDTELALDAFAHLDEAPCLLGDPVIDGLAGSLHGGAGASEEGDAHGHGADIETIVLNHLDGVQDIGGIKTRTHSKSRSWR